MENIKRENVGNKQNMGDVDLTRPGRVCVSRLFYLLEQTLFGLHKKCVIGS
ncbi:MAG: hypothetical protein QME45_01540 [Clostridiales bacterium]|nr:hypothetical protein [Clostridiales bacterium]